MQQGLRGISEGTVPFGSVIRCIISVPEAFFGGLSEKSIDFFPPRILIYLHSKLLPGSRKKHKWQ